MTETPRTKRDKNQPSTRERIQETAIALFSELGYERTSLREIAERLGVTKAALYYHFKTKEEIAASFFDSYAADVDRVCEWGEAQPRTIEARRELLRHYAEVVHSHTQILRFQQYNQAALTRLDRGSIFRQRNLRMHALLCDESDELLHRMRSWDAITTIYSNWITFPRAGDSDQEIRDASLDISIRLLEANDRERAARREAAEN